MKNKNKSAEKKQEKAMTGKKAWLVVVVMMLVYAAIFGAVSAYRQYNFQTQTWDMGAFVQTMWNSAHGRWMQNSLEEARNHLGVHMSPFLFLLVPFYAVFPSPYTLLIVQTLALALGAWPLYLLAKKVLGGRWPYIVAGGYLLTPSLHWVNIFDFHEIAFFPVLFLAALYCLEVNRWGWAMGWLALAASTKEDAVLVVAVVGLYLLLKRRSRESVKKKTDTHAGNFHPNPSREGTRWRQQPWARGVIIFAGSLLYFIISVKIIMPALGGGLVRLDRYAQFGSSAGEIVRTMVTHPGLTLATMFAGQKLLYVFWLFLPVAWLPFFSGTAFFLLVPGLLENLLTTFEFQFSGLYQYDAILVGALWVCTVYGLRNIKSRLPARERLLVGAVAATILVGFFFRSPLNPLHFPVNLFKTHPRWEAYRQMVALVPADARVAAQTNMVPHLAHRTHVYMLGREPYPMDMALIDAQDGFGFTDTEAFQAYIDQYTNSPDYDYNVYGNRYVVVVKKGIVPTK